MCMYIYFLMSPWGFIFLCLSWGVSFAIAAGVGAGSGERRTPRRLNENRQCRCGEETGGWCVSFAQSKSSYIPYLHRSKVGIIPLFLFCLFFICLLFLLCIFFICLLFFFCLFFCLFPCSLFLLLSPFLLSLLFCLLSIYSISIYIYMNISSLLF